MVMAESERASGPLTPSGLDSSTNSTASRLQWLKQRREALQEKLARKNNELKNLCIDEAELTGVLPPEIPLDPGESPPIFRKRVGTLFTYPQNLINKLKTNQVESALELERQVQAGIATAALAIVNDLSESKAVRRKHRLIYQQSQRRLKELETRLNFVRQGYGQLSHRPNTSTSNELWRLSPNEDDFVNPDHVALKQHKTKKPRPPLESAAEREGGKLAEKKGWQETEIHNTASAVTISDWHRMKPRYIKHPEWTSNTLPVTTSIDQNEDTDLYVFNDQHRVRTYSHGNWEDSSGIPAMRNVKSSQGDERSYRKISDTYALDSEIRQKDMNHWQQKKMLDPKYTPLFNHNQRQHHIDSLQYRQQQQHHQQQQFKCKSQRAYHQDQQLPPREKSSPNDMINVENVPHYRYSHSRGNHISHSFVENPRDQDHEFMSKRISSCETMTQKGKGRKSSDNSTTWSCLDENIWYCPTSVSDNYQPHKENFGSLDRRKHMMLKEPGVLKREHHISNQHRLDHPPPPPPPLPPPPHTRILLRTQSLGSVETWQSGTPALPIGVTMSRHTTDHHMEKHHEKEKDWYETSMDSGYSAPQQVLPPAVQRLNYSRSSPSPSSVPSSPKLLAASPSPLPPSSPSFNDISVKISQSTEKDLEIPAESSPHCVKYQPYREVTKPFEMSDFYKYSTKFRKRNELANNQRPVDHSQNANNINNNNANYANNNISSGDNHQISTPTGSYGPPVQRWVYESQLITRTIPRKNEGNTREWNSPDECRVPSNDSTVV